MGCSLGADDEFVDIVGRQTAKLRLEVLTLPQPFRENVYLRMLPG
jgi:hypothetical protein